MKVFNNFSLKNYNSFGLDVSASKVVIVNTINDVLYALTAYDHPFKVLGGGSNIVFSENIDQALLKNEIKGIEILDEDHEQCLVRVGGGENWHFFVLWAVHHNLSGIENLALIPGTVGAAPIQNIGAYGVEQDQLFHSCRVVDLVSGIKKVFYKSDCKFGYRDSIFKNQAKDQYFIADVTYVLKKNSEVNTDYRDVQQYLQQHDIKSPTIADVCDAVIAIRTKKLPDPKVIGNAGSFFKNPIISVDQFNTLKKQYPEIVSYPVNEQWVKIPAAWLIDQCGFKGVIKGNTGTYHSQALVIVNHGNASGKEILDFALDIQTSVSEKFDLDLEVEVNIW